MEQQEFDARYIPHCHDVVLPTHLCYQELALFGLSLPYANPPQRSRMGMTWHVGWENMDGTCLGEFITGQFKWEE